MEQTETIAIKVTRPELTQLINILLEVPMPYRITAPLIIKLTSQMPKENGLDEVVAAEDVDLRVAPPSRPMRSAERRHPEDDERQ